MDTLDIVQITAVGTFPDISIFGLGGDGKMYKWNWTEGIWKPNYKTGDNRQSSTQDAF